MTTQEKGLIAELKVASRAIEKGYIVSKPLSDSRYDLVLDKGGTLLRVQVKYADGKSSNSTGSIPIGFRKCHKNHTLFYTEKEIDIILAYIPSLDKVVQFLPKHFHNKPAIQLRTQKPKNNQQQKLNMVDDYIW